MAAVWMAPASAAAGEGQLGGVRGEARGEPSSSGGSNGSGTLDSVRGQARGSSSGKLDSVRGEVRGGKSKSKGRRRSSRGSGSSSGDAGAALEVVGGVLDLIGAIAEASEDRDRTEITRVRTVGPEEPSHPPGFARFPYADGEPHYIVTDRTEDERRWFSSDVRIGSGFAFGGLYQGTFAAQIQAWRIALDSELAAFIEPPSPGAGPDAMMMGSTSLRVALIMAPFVRVRIGGGAQYLFDGQMGPEALTSGPVGWDLSADADVFPVKPMVFSFRVDKGRLGGADTTEARGSVGIMLRRFELYADYNLRRIGETNLHGPGLGLRTWF